LHKRRAWLAVAPLALGVLALAGGAVVRVAEAREQAAVFIPDRALPLENYPRLNQPAAPLSLVSQTGETFTLDGIRGRPVLLTFAYAHCATVCPVIVKDALEAQRMLRGTTDDPAVVIVTLDPWRDTPSRLPALAAAWQLPAGDAWVLSGSVAQVQAVLTAWNIPRTRDESTGDITHPSLIYVIDRNGRIGFASTGGSTDLAALVRRL
jgi:protein SCO1/2